MDVFYCISYLLLTPQTRQSSKVDKCKYSLLMQPVDMCNLDQYLNISPSYHHRDPSNLVLSTRSILSVMSRYLIYLIRAALARRLTRPTRPTWWWRARGPAPTSRPASSCPPAPSTSPGSPSTIRTATWSSAAGPTTGSRWLNSRKQVR